MPCAKLDDTDSADTLQTLSESALQSKRDADSAVMTLEPLLKQLDARIAQPRDSGRWRGRKPRDQAAAQGSVAAAQRSGFGHQTRQLLAVEAKQAVDSIEKIRTQQFNEQIARKVASPLSPSLWKKFAADIPLDLQRINGLIRQGEASFNAAIAQHGWKIPLLGTLAALVLMFPAAYLAASGAQLCRV